MPALAEGRSIGWIQLQWTHWAKDLPVCLRSYHTEKRLSPDRTRTDDMQQTPSYNRQTRQCTGARNITAFHQRSQMVRGMP